MTTMRGHGEGSLYRRRTGQYVSAVTMRDGRRVTRTSHSPLEARAALVELLRLRDARAPITDRIRLGAYLERWVSDDHGLAHKTLERYRGIVRLQLVPALGHIRLSDLRPDDLRRAMDGWLRDGLDPQTVRHVRAALRRALADAVRDGLISRNAAALAQPPKLNRRERTVLDAAGARLLIESTRGTRYGPLWTLLVTTGLRISEALGLAWSDVDFGGNDDRASLSDRGRDAGLARTLGSPRDGRGRGVQQGQVDHRDQPRVLAGQHRAVGAGLAPHSQSQTPGPSLTVRHQLARENGEWVRRPPKTDKGRRTIPLTALGVEALRTQKAQQAADLGDHPAPIDGLVFTTSKGQPIHGENTVKALYAALDAAGLPRVTQHDLRHSCATLLYAMGVPLETISDILGHSTTRITADLYRHRVDELARAAADKLQEALG